MYCPNCGTKVSDGAKFCPNCGNQISVAKPTVSTASKNKVSVSANSAGKIKTDLKYLVLIVVFALLLLAVFSLKSPKPRGTYYCYKSGGLAYSITVNGDKYKFENHVEDRKATENGRIIEVDETQKEYNLITYYVELEDGRTDKFFYWISEDMIEKGQAYYSKVK